MLFFTVKYVRSHRSNAFCLLICRLHVLQSFKKRDSFRRRGRLRREQVRRTSCIRIRTSCIRLLRVMRMMGGCRSVWCCIFLSSCFIASKHEQTGKISLRSSWSESTSGPFSESLLLRQCSWITAFDLYRVSSLIGCASLPFACKTVLQLWSSYIKKTETSSNQPWL